MFSKVDGAGAALIQICLFLRFSILHGACTGSSRAGICRLAAAGYVLQTQFVSRCGGVCTRAICFCKVSHGCNILHFVVISISEKLTIYPVIAN